MKQQAMLEQRLLCQATDELLGKWNSPQRCRTLR